MITLSSVVYRSTDQLAAEVDGDTVLMSVASGNYYGLNSIGSDIWNRLEQPMPVEDLCQALERDYDAPLAEIRRDVLALLNEMAAHDLILPG